MPVRLATTEDEARAARLRAKLWPESPEEEHRDEVRAILAGNPPGAMPLVLFVAEVDDHVAGFVEVGLRSHADGCDPSRPCGFLEGWYVAPAFRKRGLGRALVRRAEAWCRAQGCTEIASDAWIDHPESRKAHQAVGFEEVDRCVNYRKVL